MEIGKVPKEWEVVRLGEVCEFKRGFSYRSNQITKDFTKVRFITINDIEKEGGIKRNSEKIFIKESVNIDPELFLNKGDILIANTDMSKGFIIGAPILIENINGKLIYSMDLTKLIFNKSKINSKFLFYYLKHNIIRQKMKSFAQGTNVLHLNHDLAKLLKLPLPPLPEQQKIAEILSTVDSAIEKVNQAIEKTQRLKKGLMQELLTKGIGHNEFKDTEIGRIPKEWEVVRLGEVADLNRGRFAHRPRNDPKFYGGKIPFIQTGDINEANGIIKKYSQTLNEKGLKISKLFKKGTIVISIAGNIGDVGILDFDACFPDSIIGINPNDKKVDRLFLVFLLQEFKDKLNAIAPRSTQKNINLEILEPLKLPLPPLPEQQKIAEILSTVDKRLEFLKKKKEKLERIKKGLMNDLLTGKRRTRIC